MALAANDYLEKKKDSLIKKSHVRSQSSQASNLDTFGSDNRGWLESVSVQVKPSHSLDRKSLATNDMPSNNTKKHIKTNISQKDILGAVSDEDILKLTEMTVQLPKPTINNSKPPPKQRTIEKHNPLSVDQQPAPSLHSSEILLDEEHDRKRSSWLYKLKKPQRSKSKSRQNDIISDEQPSQKTPAACMVEEFYQKHGRVKEEEEDVVMVEEEEESLEPFLKRRHSFDSFHSFQKEPKEESNIQITSEFENQPQEKTITLLFDYCSLPKELKSLIDAYEYKGKVKHVRKTVWYENGVNSDTVSNVLTIDDEDEDEELNKEEEEQDVDDDNEENPVYHKHIIKGEAEKVNYRSNPVRDIAILTTTESENIEFTKLVQIPSQQANENGPLLDLHVSLLGDAHLDFDSHQQEEDIQDMLRDLEAKIKSVKAFKKESEHFLQEHFDTMESIDIYAHTLPRTVSNPQLKSFIPEAAASSSTDNKYASHRHSMYDESSLFKQQDPFDNKIKDVTFLVKSLGEELSEFKCCLDSTEELVHDVQVDVDDFRNRMETYIKDIPESHYSALKQLEIDIESILSKRAKNPWLDTGYALLSYLLTLFALIVWIVICMLKLSKKTVLFPYKLWRDYSDYLVERNRIVKKASMRSVGSVRSSRHSNTSQQERTSSSSSFVTAYGDGSLQRTPNSSKK